MRYPNWHRVDNESEPKALEWEFKDADVVVEVHKEISGDSWFVDAQDNTGLNIFGDSTNIGTVMPTKKKAKVVAMGLLDAIHSVYHLKTFPELDSEPKSNRNSPKENVLEYVKVGIPENLDEEDVAKGYWSGVNILGFETSERPVMEFQRAFFDYWMSQHRIEPEVSARYNIIGDGNDIDEKKYYENPLKRSSWLETDLSDLPEGEPSEEEIREAEEKISEMRDF